MILPFLKAIFKYAAGVGNETMVKRKTKVETVQEPQADAQTVVQNGLNQNPEVRLVLEIAQRARELAVTVVPVSMEPSGELRATSSSSLPVPMW